MSTKRAYWIVAPGVLCLSLLVGGCGPDPVPPKPPEPGELTVNVSTNGSAGAAFKLTVTGEGITNPVKVEPSHQIYTAASGNTLNAAVIGTVSTGALLKFSVPDVARAKSYSVTLNEVAGVNNVLLSQSFSVSISK